MRVGWRCADHLQFQIVAKELLCGRVTLVQVIPKGAPVGSYIAAHGLVTILLIAVIHGIQWLVILAGDPKLFDVIPLRYILDGMDLGLLLVFVVLGTTEAVRVLGSQNDG
jgi:hypothetical protein